MKATLPSSVRTFKVHGGRFCAQAIHPCHYNLLGQLTLPFGQAHEFVPLAHSVPNSTSGRDLRADDLQIEIVYTEYLN
jgi:hypothetical protein